MTERTTDGISVSSRPFQGQAAVCGIGSVPFVDVGEAIELVARWAPEVPFWPQLRRRSPMESMIPQTFGRSSVLLTQIPGEYGYRIPADRLDRFVNALRREDVGIDAAYAAGLDAFVEAFEQGVFPRARAVKGQMMGPVTVTSSLYLDDTPILQNPELRDLVLDYLVRLARWQAERLARLHEQVILVLDEAYLGMAVRGHPKGRDAIVELLRAIVLRVRKPNVRIGIHCCDVIPFDILADIQPDIYFFDAWNGAEEFCADSHVRRFIADGGWVGWGWIPTRDDLHSVDPARILDRWTGVVQQLCESGAGPKIDPERLLERSLVTASCGLGGSSMSTCLESFRLAEEVRQGYTQPVKRR